MAGVRVSAVPGVEPELGRPAVCPAEEGTPAGQVEGVRQVGDSYPIYSCIPFPNIDVTFR